MTNCIEYVFLENLIINYIVIYQLNNFTKTKVKKTNMLIGIVVISAYTTLNYFLFNKVIENILVKLLIIAFCIYIIYRPKKIKHYFKVFIYYFLISFLLVGIVISITLFFNLNLSNILLKIITYCISGILLFVFNKFLWKLWKSKIRNDNLIYILKIKEIEIPAFVDTGNNVYDNVNKLDVIFIERKYYENLLKNNLLNKKIAININTVTGDKECFGYIVKNVKVFKNKKQINEFKKINFVFVDRKLNLNNEYNALISYDTYLDKLKGVTLC